VYIGANGAIDFISSDIPDENVDLSTYTATNKAIVAAFWDDLQTKTSVYDPPDGLVFIKASADENLPDTFGITWNNVQIKSTGEVISFQILIIDAPGTHTDFLFHYKTPFSYDVTLADPTIGLYSNVGSGAAYAQYSYDENPIGLYNNLWLTEPTSIYWKNPSVTEVGEEDNGLPDVFKLVRVSPNLIYSSAEISFAVPKDANVKIDVYDAVGRRVATIANGRFKAGYHTVTWNASDIANGIYFIHMKAGAFNQTRRVVVMR
jgi:rhodanese-related sulfurtransferase